MIHCMKDKTKRLRLNWYKLLYSTEDKDLINIFWVFYKRHHISKNRAARCVLIHYYSTANVKVPDMVLEAFRFNRDRRIAQTEIPWNDPVKLEELL